MCFHETWHKYKVLSDYMEKAMVIESCFSYFWLNVKCLNAISTSIKAGPY